MSAAVASWVDATCKRSGMSGISTHYAAERLSEDWLISLAHAQSLLVDAHAKGELIAYAVDGFPMFKAHQP